MELLIAATANLIMNKATCNVEPLLHICPAAAFGMTTGVLPRCPQRTYYSVLHIRTTHKCYIHSGPVKLR